MVIAQPLPPPIAGAGPPGAVERHCGLLRSLRGLWTHGHPVLLDGSCTLAICVGESLGDLAMKAATKGT